MERYVENFLEIIKNYPPGKNENWPLAGNQILAYFDVDQSLDIYYRIDALINNGVSEEEIGKLFRKPTILRYFLTENGILGLKIAKAFKIKDIGTKNQTEYFETLSNILKTMVVSDPFCLDGKNLVWNQEEVDGIKDRVEWIDITEQNRKKLLGLNVDLFAFAWSYFYNLFTGLATELQGSYEIMLHGKAYKMVVRDSFEMNPKEIWGIDTGLSPIKMYFLYKDDTEYKLNFENQPVTYLHNEGLVKIGIEYGNRFVVNEKAIEAIGEKITTLNSQAHKIVNSMSPIDQVRKGAYISYYSLRKFYEKMNEDWRPDKTLEPFIKKFGNEFITKKGNDSAQREAQEWARILDPRDDYIGSIGA